MKTVFVDIDTQIDFLFPAGALYVPGAEALVDTVAALNRYAQAHGIPVLSTTDAHAENDGEFTEYAPHCIAGTVGQQKPQATLLEPRVVIPAVPAPPIAVEGAAQIILEKDTVDMFRNRNLPRLLEALGAGRYVVYGVVTEICVRHAAMGLLKTGARVEVVADAVRHLREPIARQMLAEFRQGGGTVTSVAAVMESAL